MSLVTKLPELPSTARGELEINSVVTQFDRSISSGGCATNAAAVEAEIG
jgi:hypothetical protein